LDSAAIELGSMTLNCHSMSLSLLLDGTVGRYLFAAEQKQQTIAVEIDDNVMVVADADRLEQVFDNLLSNAVKYSLLGTTITVRVFAKPNIARVEIHDAGPGISAEDQTKLFGLFQRLSAMPTGGESSNGVGLSITKNIVDLHEGHIWVESELGHGATFIVELAMKADGAYKTGG
jgi:signal transduction histidine kinase